MATACPSGELSDVAGLARNSDRQTRCSGAQSRDFHGRDGSVEAAWYCQHQSTIEER
jgi:hypothetical protein